MKTNLKLPAKVRYFLCTLLVIVIFQSCDGNIHFSTKDKKKFTVVAEYGSGWEYRVNYIQVDSLNIENIRSATLWIDGIKINVIADRISFYSNNR